MLVLANCPGSCSPTWLVQAVSIPSGISDNKAFLACHFDIRELGNECMVVMLRSDVPAQPPHPQPGDKQLGAITS